MQPYGLAKSLCYFFIIIICLLMFATPCQLPKQKQIQIQIVFLNAVCQRMREIWSLVFWKRPAVHFPGASFWMAWAMASCQQQLLRMKYLQTSTSPPFSRSLVWVGADSQLALFLTPAPVQQDGHPTCAAARWHMRPWQDKHEITAPTSHRSYLTSDFVN